MVVGHELVELAKGAEKHRKRPVKAY